MRITVLCTGPLGARFVAGLVDSADGSVAAPDIDVVCGTGEDITLHGLRVCPDVDALLDVLGDAPTAPGATVADTLACYDAGATWWPVTDGEVGTHLARTTWLSQGLSLSEATARLADRRGLTAKGVRLRPMSDVPVETHAVLDGEEEQRAVHVQQWRHEMGREPAPARFVVAGLDRATAAPGVLDTIRSADVVLLAPSDPVTGLGTMLGVPGIRDAVRGCSAPVVGVSPVGVMDLEGLTTTGVDPTSAGIARLFEDLLDGWVTGPGEPEARIPGRCRTAAHQGSVEDAAQTALRLDADLR